MWVSSVATLVMCMQMILDCHGVTESFLVRQCERNSGNFHWNLKIACSGENEKIRIATTFWGRTKPARLSGKTPIERFCPCSTTIDQKLCLPTSDFAKHAFNSIKALCHGQPSCTIEPTIDVLRDPCPGQYKYLEVGYTCGVPATKAPTTEAPTTKTPTTPVIPPKRCHCKGTGNAEIYPFSTPPVMPIRITKVQKSVISSYKKVFDNPCKYQVRAFTCKHRMDQMTKVEYFKICIIYVSFGRYSHKKKPTKMYRHFKIYMSRDKAGKYVPNYSLSGTRLRNRKLPLDKYRYHFPNRKIPRKIARANFGFQISYHHGLVKVNSTCCSFNLDIDVRGYAEQGIQFELETQMKKDDKATDFKGYCLACTDEQIARKDGMDSEEFNKKASEMFRL